MSSRWPLPGTGQASPPCLQGCGLHEWAVWFVLLTLGGVVQGEVFDHRNVYGGVSNGINRCPRLNTCANGKCYDNTQQCNGKNDCGDNSDEWECDVLNKFNTSSRKGFVWPWWIVGLTCAVVVFTCVAIICRYVNERTDPSLDTYLLEAPTPRRSRPRHRSSDRSRSRTHSRGDEIEMQRKTTRTKRERPRNTDTQSPKSPRAGRSEDTFRERPKGKKIPPPIPPPPRASPSDTSRGATSSEYTVDIEPLPPPPAPQPTRSAPPVPVVQQHPVPPPVKPKPKPKARTTSGSTAGSESEAGSSLPPPPGSPEPPTAWARATSAPIRGGSTNPLETPPPSYSDVQLEGYRTLQVDQRSAMARGEESPNIN